MPDKIVTNLCPGCGEKITKRTSKGACPHCGVTIKLMRTSEGKRNRFHYELAVEPVVVPEPVTPTDEEIIFTGAGVVIYKLPASADTHYRVDITVRMQRVVCPKCQQVAFEPRETVGGVKHKCNRCNSFTLFNFQLFRKI